MANALKHFRLISFYYGFRFFKKTVIFTQNIY